MFGASNSTMYFLLYKEKERAPSQARSAESSSSDEKENLTRPLDETKTVEIEMQDLAEISSFQSDTSKRKQNSQ